MFPGKLLRRALTVGFCCIALASELPAPRPGPHIAAFEAEGARGIAITGAGEASVQQSRPIQLDFYSTSGDLRHLSFGYERLQVTGGSATGTAEVKGPWRASFVIRDQWSVQGSVVQLARAVTVSGTDPGGFLSAITLPHAQRHARSQVEYFAPGVIYGGTSHLTAQAIGGSDTYSEGRAGKVRVREDRLPAPLFGVRFPDGSSLTVLDAAPDGGTTAADSHDTSIRTLIDDRFRFGAVGVDLDNGRHAQGFWFPGTEGEATYRGATYPGGQVAEWRRRYHPIQNGLTQRYRVAFRFSRDPNFSQYMRAAWRWAFATLKPAVTFQDISAARRSIVDVLASEVEVHPRWAGIPNAVPAIPVSNHKADRKAIMGFTGKNLESAEFLLADGQTDRNQERAAQNRRLGLAILGSFIRLRMDPPVSEGFNLDTGEPALAIPRDQRVYLRSFGDAMKAILRAYHRERARGYVHADWLAWAEQFGHWLLTQQTARGGFPRAWRPATGEVVDTSPQSTYNVIPFLVLLSAETRDARYLTAAQLAGEFSWATGQAASQFVGGTIDNPDVLDKEAGTLSLEAYLALFRATHNRKWLQRAQAAADYAETYVYIWNVPMPVDEQDSSLQWKRGVSTCGTQLIATGHSLVDDYMAFDVDEYAEVGRLTGESHYLRLAKLLLHNTKNMLAVPGRTFDLKGPGWQQEHFSFAPVRGFGLHRLWLPWVATSQLNGIFELMEYDPALYKQWTKLE